MIWRAIALSAVVSMVWLAPQATASTASLDGKTLTFLAGPGEANTVSIAYDATLASYKISDTTAATTGGNGCGAAEHEIDCEGAQVQVIVINLRDGNDRWLGGDIKLLPSIDGGAGD